MPFYEYECRECKHVFEAMRPMNDRDKPLPCPKCESVEVGRKLSTFAAVAGSPSGCSPAKAANCANAGFG